MSKRLQELCALVVEDTCGHLASQIFSTLAQKGRHTVGELRREFPHITLRQMRQALVTLLQQHVVLYHQADDGPTYYHADWRNPARSTRAALIAALVAERHGDGAAKIVSNLLELGHARVGDLAQAFDFTPTSKRDSGYESCNGHGNGIVKGNGVPALDAHKTKGDKIATVGQFHNTLRALLKAGILVKRAKQNYMPAADLQAQIEAVVISEQFPDGKINGAKKQAEFQAAVKTLKRKRQEANEYSATRDNESRGQIRRPGAPTSNPATKRAKLNGGLPNGVHHDDDLNMDDSVPKLPSDLVLAVNFAQYPTAHRSQRLEQFAQANLGGVTATVYAALLQVLETRIKARDDDIHEDQDSEDEEARLPSATTTEIADVLKSWAPVDLTLGIHGAASMYKKPEAERDKSKKGKKRTVPDDDWGDIGIKREVQSDEDDDEQAPSGFTSYRDQNNMLSLIEEHLKLLAEHPKTFCRRVGGGGRGEWKVDFGALTNTLIAYEIDQTVQARLSKVHALIVRMLRDVGRLEDKEIAARLMMRVKDVRAILTQLQFAALVEGQEVPKDNSRQPSRAVYLWYHDQTRVAAILLQQAYQGMSRLLQRLAVERENFRGIIEKAEMMNTKEDSLSQVERETLMQWREIEEKLMVQFLRMDEHVALLRDFSGKDTSLVS